MKPIERVEKFKPDYLIKDGYDHYMVKGEQKVYIHKSTFDIAKKKYEVR